MDKLQLKNSVPLKMYENVRDQCDVFIKKCKQLKQQLKDKKRRLKNCTEWHKHCLEEREKLERQVKDILKIVDISIDKVSNMDIDYKSGKTFSGTLKEQIEKKLKQKRIK